MAVFGRSRELDVEALVAELQAKQNQLVREIEDLEAGGGGGGGRFWLGLLAGAALGAGALYLLDPEKGEERRLNLLGAAGAFGGGADDMAARDQQVNERVEGQLFSDASVPRGQININTVDGVVYVRGTATSQEQIAEIERRIKGIEGVDAVINLLRLPATAQA